MYQNNNYKNNLSKWSSVLIMPHLDFHISIYCEMFLVEYFINIQYSNMSYHFLFRFLMLCYFVNGEFTVGCMDGTDQWKLIEVLNRVSK